jgi:cytochrome c oxidase subunit 4
MERRPQALSRPLVLTWLALLLLLATSAGTAWLKLGWVNTAIGLAVATVKAVLVALVFMRLRRAHALLRLAAVAGITTLAMLFGLAGADYAARMEVRAPWQQPSTLAPKLSVHREAQVSQRPTQVAMSLP